MKVKKIPLRKCIGCNQMKPKKDILRVVRNQQGEIRVDATGKAHGRGAYICRDISCFENAKKTKAFNRAFQCEITPDIYNQLIEEIGSCEQ